MLPAQGRNPGVGRGQECEVPGSLDPSSYHRSLLLFHTVSSPNAPPWAPDQSCIDWNREVLKRELGLAEGDIVDIPQLFRLVWSSKGNPKAEAFFPNMVRR